MKENIKLALFHPEDAQDICNIYREIYGDDFPISYVYDPEEIIKRYDGINHRTAIARSGEGEFAGMASMCRSAHNPLLYEAVQLMVKKKFRESGVAQCLADTIHNDFPEQIALDAQFIEALCNHTISQRVTVSHDFMFTGLELEWLQSVNFDNSKKPEHNKPERNISLLLTFRMYSDSAHEIFIHPAYEDFVKGICRDLKATRTFRNDIIPGMDTTENTVDIIKEAGIATLAVTKAGADLPEVLARFEAEAKSCQLHVQIDISHPWAPWAIDIMRQKGFFLSGYLPLWFKGDGLMLQKLTVAPDFTLPRFFTQKGELIMQAVQNDYERTLGEK